MNQLATTDKPKNEKRSPRDVIIHMICEGQTKDAILEELERRGLQRDETEALFNQVAHDLKKVFQQATNEVALRSIFWGFMVFIMGCIALYAIVEGFHRTPTLLNVRAYAIGVIALGMMFFGAKSLLEGLSTLKKPSNLLARSFVVIYTSPSVTY